MNKDSSTLAKNTPTRSPRFLTRSLLFVALVGLGLWIISSAVSRLVVESLWFNQLGYLEVFWLRVGTKLVAGIVVTGLSLLFIFANLLLVHRWSNDSPDEARGERRGVRGRGDGRAERVDPSTGAIAFRAFLPPVLALSGLIGLLTLNHAQAGLSLRQATDLNTVPFIPDRLQWETAWRLMGVVAAGQITPYLGVALLLAGTIALLIYPNVVLSAIALGLSLNFGFVLEANWSQILLFLHATPFDRAEPLFTKDIGFYLFTLPIWQLVEFWGMGLSLYTLLAVALLYLLAGNSLSRGTFGGFTLQQQRHLGVLSGCLMLIVSLRYWLSRYELLYSAQGVVFGASYTDVHVQLPLYSGLAGLAAAIALWLFWRSVVLPSDASKAKERRFMTRTLFVLGGFLLLATIATTVLPPIVQRLVVQPNELTREQPYIRRSVALTREAFDLEKIQVETFNPAGDLTAADLQQNRQTVRNIRLWDTRPLLQTNRQLQQIRSYYRFFDADIDRYTLAETSQKSAATGKQQVLISARELDYGLVPTVAKTWVNEHLVYTHGYGFTLTPVNKVAPGGLPDYFVKDIGSSPQSNQNLSTSSDQIRASIPIGEPRIYFGEITNTYVMTGTRLQELDYPSGNDNVYNTYDGVGGVSIGNGWTRSLFARYLHDWQMLLTGYFTPQTKVMLRRNVVDRVRAIAPFLQFDSDPYLVTADIGCRGLDIACGDQNTASTPTPNYLYWIIDAYTVGDHYPYAEPSKGGLGQAGNLNYIRNSVKVVVDAYNGAVNFYITDAIDPIIRSWMAIFPQLFKPLDAMPIALRSHIRYPSDLFSVQAERLLTYHMTDPQVFYNKEDQWEIPNEIYGSQPQQVEPYFLITKLPTVVGAEEFILLLPYKPAQRTNLTAWLAARSDGENYGKQLLYLFPKQQLVYGTEQIEARINQDPVISQKISLWNRQGSRVLQGNLLVIPIEQSLLYVEPLYLEAEQNSLPTLVSVVAVYQNRIVIAESLEQSLRAVFQDSKPATPAIVRPVE